MKPLLTLLLMATLLAVPLPAQAVGTVTLDGVRVRLRPGTRQVVTVNRTSGHHARITFWSRPDGGWTERFRAAEGRIGHHGLVRPRRRVQGSGKTPLATFRMPWAFGMHRQQRHRGGAILLDVNGDGATAGCVSTPRWFVKRLMGRLDQDRAPLIAIGR